MQWKQEAHFKKHIEIHQFIYGPNNQGIGTWNRLGESGALSLRKVGQ